ncbi:hypothetical protein [Photobacterium sanctipauli]|nr:hypothetical protein [Photobacterium sanctipauli]
MSTLENVKTKLEVILLCIKVGLAVFAMVWLTTGNWDKLLDLLA